MSKGTRTVNEVIMIGQVANDPILKESQNWQKLVVFNISTKRVWITKDWEKKEEVQYHKVATWWRLAEKADKILKKWINIYIRWYLHNRKIQIEWEEKSRIITEIILNDLLILDKKKKLEDESEDFISEDENSNSNYIDDDN
jgi:single-strand DNA-binding protein